MQILFVCFVLTHLNVEREQKRLGLNHKKSLSKNRRGMEIEGWDFT